jgi:hypothetical protein
VRWVRQPGCGGATGPAGPDVGTSRGWRCWPGRRRAGRGRGPASWCRWPVPSASSGPQRRRSCRPVRWVRQPGCGGATGPAGPDVGTSRGWRCWPGRRRAGQGRGPASWCCGAAGSAWLRCASVPGLDVPGDPVPHRPVIPAAGASSCGRSAAADDCSLRPLMVRMCSLRIAEPLKSGPGLVARKLGAAAAPVAAFSRLYGARLRAWFRLWRAVLGGGDPCRS